MTDRREYKQKHYQDNKDRYCLYSREYYKRNREEISERRKKVNSTEESRRKRREYYAKNKEHIRKRDNASTNPRRAARLQEWRDKNREKIRTYQREWRRKRDGQRATTCPIEVTEKGVAQTIRQTQVEVLGLRQ